MKITKNTLKRIIRETINEVGGPWGPEIPRKQGCPPCPPCDERQVDPFKGLPIAGGAKQGYDASLADVKPTVTLGEGMGMDPLALVQMMCTKLGRVILEKMAHQVIEDPSSAREVLGGALAEAGIPNPDAVIGQLLGAEVPGLGMSVESALEQAEGFAGAMVKPILKKMVPQVLDQACKAKEAVEDVGAGFPLEESKVTKSTLKRMVRQALARMRRRD